MNKIIKRLIACILCFSIIAPACVFAYTPGAREYTYKPEGLLSSSKASLNSGTLTIDAGGYASMDLLLPFTAVQLDIGYSAVKDANLTITTNLNSYSAALSAKETNATIALVSEKIDDTILTIASDAAVTIKSMTFTKEDQDISPSNVNAALVLSAFEDATQTTVAIADDAVALFDHGAIRYLDFDNTRTVPKYFDGKLYIPVFALARALDAYYEDYQDLEYVFLRSQDEKLEIFYEKGEAYYVTAGKKSKIELPVVYDGSLTWLPVKQVAELFEKTVISKSGITVIDYKLNAQNVVNNSGVFSELQSTLNRYILQDNSGSKTYHVSKDIKASDYNPGTESYPFKTIQKAADIAEPGDTVIVHEGTYSEAVVPKNSGTPSKPIKFMAAEGEEVWLSNVTELSGFVKYDGDIWCVEVPENVGKYRLQVFHEDEALPFGRHPNTHSNEKAVPYNPSVNDKIFATRGDLTVKIDQKNDAYSSTLSGQIYATSESGALDQLEKDYWKGATWTGLKGQGWNLTTAPVNGSEFGKIHFDDGGYKQTSLVYFWVNYEEDWGYLSNHIHCVDLPGEWYYDGETLYIIPPEGVNGEDLTVTVKQGFKSFDLTDKSFIEVHNINTRAASMTMAGNTEHNVINGGTHEYVSYSSWVALTSYTLEGYINTVEHPDDSVENGCGGLYLDGTNNSIVNAKFKDAAIQVITIPDTSKFAFVYNNDMSDIGYTQGDVAISIHNGRGNYKGGGHQLIHNTIHGIGAQTVYSNNSYEANAVNACMPLEIAYNHLYDSNQYTRDSGTHYMHYGHYGTDREFTKMHHNMLHDALVTHRGGTSINAIYFDNSTSGIECFHNLIYWKDQESPLTPVYVQRKNAFPDTYSNVPNYTNKSLALVEEDVDMQDLSEIPNGKPYLVGAKHATDGIIHLEDGKFLENYKRFRNDYDSIYASEAVLTNGATFSEDGYAEFNGDGAITFENIDLTGKNNIVAYMTGESSIRDYVLRLEILDKDGTVVENDPVPIMITGFHNDASMEIDMRTMDFEGEYDVRLSIYENNQAAENLRISRIRTEMTTEESVLPLRSQIIYGGAFTDTIWNSLQYHTAQSHYQIANMADRTHHYANYVFENTLVYKNVTITEDFTDFIAYVQANTGDNNYFMQVRTGSETGPVVIEVDLNYVPEILGGRDVEGYVWRKHKLKLNEPMKAGTYDFYLTFEDRDDPGFAKDANTCDIAYFGFYNEADQ